MKLLAFSNRCTKEILRDPINLFFGLGFPGVILLLLSAIQANIPVPLFEIESLAPGITVFGLSFMTLFSATLLAKDRESEFLQRLYTTPLTGSDYILGYLLPVIPMAVLQSFSCYLLAIVLGLPVTINILFATFMTAPISVLYIALGLLFGSMCNVKQVGGLCGGLLTNVSAWLSGVWFDLDLIGGTFEKIANALPFVHAVKLQKAILNGNYDGISNHLIVVFIYAVVILTFAIFFFLRQMRKQ